MEPLRYEIEPRPAALGGGWRLHFFGHDMETGEEIEMNSGVVPLRGGEDEVSAYADAGWVGDEWLAAKSSFLGQLGQRN